ncbi:MAG: amino acid racemase [Clostridium sp.]
MSKTLGIIGGMGPLATVELFKKIVCHTNATCDQDHIRVLIDNNTSIPDRTENIIGEGEDPKKYLIESAQKLQSMGANYLIMPCNTAHYFYKDIIKEIEIPFLNMIEETANIILKRYPLIKKIGLLATKGTCCSGVYDDVFSLHGIELVKPYGDEQKHVTDLIYGIKEGVQDVDLTGFYETVESMGNHGVHLFILGCTELSVAYEKYKLKGNYVDPLSILAMGAIAFAGKKVVNF